MLPRPVGRLPLISFAILLVLLFASALTQSKVQRLPLYNFVVDSDTIIIGTVLSVEMTSEKYIYPQGNEEYYQRAIMNVEEVISGVFGDSAISIYFNPRSSIEPNFIVGEKYLTFLKKREDKWRVYNGYSGKIRIDDDLMLIHISMADQKRAQMLDSFISKIRDILEESD